MSLYSPITTAALGGERIPSRASIYIHSPLRSASGLQRLRSHDDTVVRQGRGDSRFLSASPPVAAAGHPYWITSHHLPSQPRHGARWRPSCAFSLRQRIPERRGAVERSTQPANQNRGRKDARCTEETQP
eukprot:superscaffoldBa00000372_g4185